MYDSYMWNESRTFGLFSKSGLEVQFNVGLRPETIRTIRDETIRTIRDETIRTIAVLGTGSP